MWLGDYPEDFTTVVVPLTTHSSTGAPVAPSSAFETADFRIYKNGSSTEKATTNGLTIQSPHDTVTGLHFLIIDTSNNTGDTGFWTAGSVYTVVLIPDETVDSVAVTKVVGQFGVDLYGGLRPTTAGRTLDVTATGAAGIDWGNIENQNSLADLTATTVAGATDVTSVINVTGDVQGSVLGSVNVGSMGSGTLDAAALTSSAANEIADALLDRADGVETGLTPRNALRLAAATIGGKLSGAGTGTETVRNAVADSKDRIIVTADESGNRSAIIYDFT
jgi:hypothetical protein